jgi:ribosome modulation factor
METKSMTNQAAHDEGYDAYWEGIDISDNPYDAETDAVRHQSWESGWREARRHDYDESEG